MNQQGNGVLKVHADFFPAANLKTLPSAGITQILILLCDGDDHATIDANIDITAIMDGGRATITSTAAAGPISFWAVTAPTC